MEKQLKTIPFEIKNMNDEERSFDAVASNEDIDRDGDRIMAAGWDLDNFIKNPVIPWAHNYGEPPVARATQIGIKDGRLMFRPKFPTAEEYPFADTIWKLYKGGYLKAFSVGFMPKRWEYVERGAGKRGRDYMEQELWEISACTVPSNPNALVAAKSAGVISEEEEKILTQSHEATKDEAEPETLERGILNREPSTDLLAQIERINKNLDTLGENLAELLKDRRQPQPSPASAAPQPDTDTDHGHESPPLTPDALKTAIAEALSGIERRIETAVDKRINYHLGIVK
jgi:HK97 family phage prohead protease